MGGLVTNQLGYSGQLVAVVGLIGSSNHSVKMLGICTPTGLMGTLGMCIVYSYLSGKIRKNG